ncbi:MAG: DUF2357 domain-containing protein [Sarcina sp.]
MASQDSGNNELLYIETPLVNLTINAENPSSIGKDSSKNIRTFIDNKEVFIADLDYNSYLKEYKNYHIEIQGKNSADEILFYNDNKNIREKVVKSKRKTNFYSGIINFRSDIGYSDIYIKVNGQEHIKVTLEVRPSKIDYKDDYKELLEDVNKEIYNLAFGFLARTYLGADVKNERGSLTEFYSILNYLFEKFQKAINVVNYSPHQCLVKEEKILNYNKIINPKNDSFRWLEKRGHLFKEIGGRRVPTKALVSKKTVTLDNNENRFLKFLLEDIVKSIDNFKREYYKTSSGYNGKVTDKAVIERIEKMENYFRRILTTGFLKDVESNFRKGDISLVFRMKAGYRDVFKYYLIIRKGLTIKSDILTISMKELSLLYEYWCFIKINSILREDYNLISSDMLKVNRNSLYVTLKKGNQSTIVYENKMNNERIEVSYNRKSYSANVAQKPDNIFTIKKQGEESYREYIFDAKYKLENKVEYKKNYGGIGPKEEDINTMHRYRDAILYAENDKRKPIVGAFVLFPYDNEKEYRNHKFYKTIDEVSIGALPFLPKSTELMREFLGQLINDNPIAKMNKEIEEIKQLV